MKAILNEEGKKVWGYAFPDGTVPVKSPFPQTAKAEGRGALEVFMVNWEALTGEQQTLVLQKLMSRFGNTKHEIEAAILSNGLPLQAKYVSHVPIPLRFLT